MSSTRNVNTRGNYKLEQNLNHSFFDNTSYLYAQKPYTFLDVYKISNSTQPTRIVNPHNLSNNPVDIESMLRGIKSTNLAGQSFKTSPDLKRVDTFDFYKRVPMIKSNMIITDQKQRPLLWS